MSDSSGPLPEEAIEALASMALIVSEYYDHLIKSGVPKHVAQELTVAFQEQMIENSVRGFGLHGL